MKEALFWKKLKNDGVQCELCPRKCIIPENKTGSCGVRKNIKGKLYSLVYGKLCSLAVDSIMKKPFFQFAPGTECLSICTVGCNLHCKFCQNYSISHPEEIFGRDLSPAEIVEIAKNKGLPGIAYTYTEPTIFYEYALEIMKLAKKTGLYNVWVSNGYTNPQPVRKIAKYLDAINVDLKGDLKFYQNLCGVPSEKPMYIALKEYKKHGIWIEITNLVIPGWNDKPEQIKKIVEFVKNNLGVDTPMHFSRFYPHYKLTNTGPTAIETLEMATKIAKKAGMRYVYTGNVAGHDGESTYCWKCGELLIKRTGYVMDFYKEKCPKCGAKIKIAGKEWI